jgi:hypothetical protein
MDHFRGGRGRLGTGSTSFKKCNGIPLPSQLPGHSAAIDTPSDNGDFHEEIRPCIRRKERVGKPFEMGEFL